MLAVLVDVGEACARGLVDGVGGVRPQLWHVLVAHRHLPVAPHTKVYHHVHPRADHALEGVLPLGVGAVGEVHLEVASAEASGTEVYHRVGRDEWQARFAGMGVEVLTDAPRGLGQAERRVGDDADAAGPVQHLETVALQAGRLVRPNHTELGLGLYALRAG